MERGKGHGIGNGCDSRGRVNIVDVDKGLLVLISVSSLSWYQHHQHIWEQIVKTMEGASLHFQRRNVLLHMQDEYGFYKCLVDGQLPWIRSTP